MSLNIKPLADRVIVQPQAQQTKGGIILPENVEGEKPEQGKVIATGPGKVLDNGQIKSMTVKVGQIVLFKKYSPDEIKVAGQEYLVISESDILAIVE